MFRFAAAGAALLALMIGVADAGGSAKTTTEVKPAAVRAKAAATASA